MASRRRDVVRTFLASPGDVQPEREVVSRVVSELNLIWSDFLGLQLELLTWETHAVPGAGAYSQAVINEVVGDDYEIFIGIMWSRFGTATPVAESGTEEEFERAYARFVQDASSVHIMMYFKSEEARKADKAQVAKVNEFRKRIGEHGVLYWMFHDTEAFHDSLRMHLSRKMQHFASLRELGHVSTVGPRHKAGAYAVVKKKLERELTADADVAIPKLRAFVESFRKFSDLIDRHATEIHSLSARGPVSEGYIVGYAMKVGAALDALVEENLIRIEEIDAELRRIIRKAAVGAPYLVHGMPRHDCPR
jgi:hypothetical protein